MNLIIKVFFIFFIFFFSEKEPIKIPWKANQKLTWADFQGKPEPRSGFVATTNSGISFSYSTTNGEALKSFNVQSYFYPKSSWYLPSQVNQHILNHEQTHFDISELHARILRKKISETTFTKNIKKEIDKIYYSVEQSRREMQQNFDAETDHSKNKDKEKQWELFVLKELKKYASK